MSAIGDYIHYTSFGYLTAGTSKLEKNMTYRGTNYSEGFKRAKTLQKAKTFNALKEVNAMKLTDKERKKLEIQIEALMQPDKSDYGETANQLWEILRNDFNNQFSEAILEIQRQTANVIKRQGAPSFTARKIGELKKGHEEKRTKVSTILNRLDKFNKYITELISVGVNPEGILITNLIDKLDKIYEEISKIHQIGAEGQNSGYAALQAKLKNLSTPLLTWEQSKNVVTAINELISAINMSANLAKGTLFEKMVAIAPLVGTNYAKKHLKNAFLSVKGNEKTSVIFDEHDFGQMVDLERVLGKGYDRINDNLWAATNASQDKVDVTLNWSHGRKLNVSAKNVTFDSSKGGSIIHLVSKASFLALMTVMQPDFVNHYLNLISVHYRNVYKENGYTTNRDLLINGVPELQQARLLMQRSLLVSAFAGYKNGADKANVFIVNDNSTGKVRIYNIGDLIQKISDSMINSVVSINPELEMIYLTRNTFNINGAGGRISNLLNEVHQQKISVSLKKSFLTTII